MNNWENVILDPVLLGETFTSGSGYYEKEYTYIRIPVSEKYEHYCFALSSKLVDVESDPEQLYITLCMAAEYILQKDPEYRETGKRYKRYKLTGQELYESVLEVCEDDFLRKTWQNRESKEKERAKREKRIKGYIVYGHYKGNTYGDKGDLAANYFFENKQTGTYFNQYHERVSNVQVQYRINKKISKHFFRSNMNVLHEKLQKWMWMKKTLESQNALLSVLATEETLRNEIIKLQQSIENEMDAELNRQICEEKTNETVFKVTKSNH